MYRINADAGLVRMTGRTRFAPASFLHRYPALDGLRALAVCLVFMQHFGGGLHGNFLMRIAGHIRERGWIGVDLFFVLSGFLITGILHDTRHDSHYFRRFYGRRALRIFPVFYALALVLLALTPLLAWRWRPSQALFLVYLGNIAALRDFSLYAVSSGRGGPFTLFLGHLWSLCVEEQFYLLWPALVWLAATRRRILLLTFAIVVAEPALRFWVVLHRSHPDAENLIFRNLVFRADTLMMGAALAMLLRGPHADLVQRACKWVFLTVLAVLVGLVTGAPDPGAPWQLSVGLTLTALMCAGLVGAVLPQHSAWAKCFTWRPLRVLGRYSYGFYLFHVLFLAFWYWLVGLVIGVAHSLVVGALLTFGTHFLLTFLLAKLSYDHLELRFLRHKRSFLYDEEQATRDHAFDLSS